MGRRRRYVFHRRRARYPALKGRVQRITSKERGISAASPSRMNCSARRWWGAKLPEVIPRCIASTWIRRSRSRNQSARRLSTGTPIIGRIAISRLPIGTRRNPMVPFPPCRRSMSEFPSFTPSAVQAMLGSEYADSASAPYRAGWPIVTAKCRQANPAFESRLLCRLPAQAKLRKARRLAYVAPGDPTRT